MTTAPDNEEPDNGDDEELEVERGGVPRAVYEFYAAAEEEGRLDGDLLHDEIANPNHPLHNRFEWDDAVAGRAYRVNQINRDIKKSYIKIWVEDRPLKVKTFTAVRYTGDTERLKGYTRTEKVVLSPWQYRHMMRELRRKIRELQLNYGHLEEFAAIMRAAIPEEDGEGETA
jgi:hypothetical protein